jgi:glycosyltransferase involved in cell wall biosynthesis
VRGLIEAVGNLRHDGRISAGQLEVQLIGALRNARGEERRQVEKCGVREIVKVLPRVPHEECIRRLAQADVLLLVQVGAPLSVPGKLFEYMALGKPMFVLTSGGATADLVEREGLGVCADPDDVGQIEEALLSFCGQFASGEALATVSADVRSRYDGRRLTEQLDAVLRDVLGRQTQS